jgi:phosphotransferase system HPr-like phosphotransfer protein
VPQCAGCGVALPTRNREAANRFCTVCSWRAGKSLLSASSAGARKASRIPIAATTEDEESAAQKIAEG